MSADRKFIDIVQARAAGRPHDIAAYMEIFEKCIREVYKNRYRLRDCDSQELYSEIVVFDEFLDACWEIMEKGRKGKKDITGQGKTGKSEGALLLKLADIEFLNDEKLLGYLYTTMSNHLEGMINDMSPGLDARKRQMNRVLKEICHEEERGREKYWFLKSKNREGMSPAPLEILRQASAAIPELPYKRRKTADGGSSIYIRDNDMRTYLQAILEKTGGMVRKSDLITLVLNHFDILTLPGGPNIDDLSNHRGKFATQDRDVMAKEIFCSLDSSLKKLYAHHHGEGIEPKELARLHGCSEGTISNRLAKIKRLIESYLKEGDVTVDSDDSEAILSMVTKLCMGEARL